MKKNILIIFITSFVIFSFNISFSAWELDGIELITRDEWIEDESLRFYDNEIYQSSINKKENMELYLKYLEEIDYKKYLIESKSFEETKKKQKYLSENFYSNINVAGVNSYYNGNRLRWPEKMMKEKKKIIIHHTAKNSLGLDSKSDVVEYLNDVYEYHTEDRLWGDIGYNFVIDSFGNIYEGRAGGQGVVGAHTKWNNLDGIGIALIGNFEEEEPTEEALQSLIKLSAVLSDIYDIDPMSNVGYHLETSSEPYISLKEHYSVAGHRDAKNTACPGEHLYEELSYIRTQIKRYKGGSSIQKRSSKVNVSSLSLENLVEINNKIEKQLDLIKQSYNKKNKISFLKDDMNKIQDQISIQEAKKLSEGNIRVLLYELSTSMDSYNVSCDGGCEFEIDDSIVGAEYGVIRNNDNKSWFLTVGNKTYNSSFVKVIADNDLVTVENYNRKSYVGVPWNSFRGELLFDRDYIKDINGFASYGNVVINDLLLKDYLKGIAETHDSEHIEKNKVIALIAKHYALFYLSDGNVHPNIPKNSNYTAVDDSRIFQKYVGAGLEKTLNKWYIALNETEDVWVSYDGYLPILPYFNCSAIFTYSADEKRGWGDTPYLETRLDLGFCKDKLFDGHGVGLSGKGSELFATRFGWEYDDIVKYYYKGVTLIHNL